MALAKQPSSLMKFRFLTKVLSFSIVFLFTLPSYTQSNPQCPTSGSPLPTLTEDTVYDIGPGEPYTTIGSFPWASLLPGDTVQIHYATYNEIVGITSRGTATQPIRIVGIPNSSGALPIITGVSGVTEGACLNPQYVHGTSERGLFWIAPSGTSPYGYKPGYIEVSNLVIEDVQYPSGTINYPAGVSPATETFLEEAAGVYIVSGENIVFTNVTITGNPNGFFVNSSDPDGDGGSESFESNNITLQYSYIYSNGVNGQELEHNQYTEGNNILSQYNYYGLQVAGATGNNLKDRSSGLVVRYNWFESAGHMLDLVDPQGTVNVTEQEPSWENTFIYGNVFHNTFTGSLIHWAGDQGIAANDRTGTAFIYDNTFVTHANKSSTYQYELIEPEDTGLATQTGNQSADMRNNIFYTEPATSGSAPPILDIESASGGACSGYVSLGVNYLGVTSSGWGDGYNLGIGACPTQVTGEGNLLLDTTDDPSFIDDSGEVYTLNTDSDAVGKGTSTLAAAVTSNPAGQNYTPLYQLVTEPSDVSSPGEEARPAISDLGYSETGVSGACSYTFYPSSITFPAAGGTATVQVLADTTCTSWTASSNSSWITGVTGSGSGVGLGNAPGEVHLSAANYSGTTAQTGTITIAGQTYNVSQLPVNTTAPTVAVTTPTSGDSISGSSLTLTATASAASNVAVAYVQFILEAAGCTNPCATYSFISDRLTGSSPYTATTDVTFLVSEGVIANGTSYQISAIATDTTGNTAQATPITVSTPTTPVTETPYFNPASGNYPDPIMVSIASPTQQSGGGEGSGGVSVTFYYTTNGTTPTTSSTLYSGPISVSSPMTLKAIATSSGYSTSGVASASYTFAAATPAFSPGTGTYGSGQTVTISDTTSGATIYYTTNGTTPTTGSTVYSGPITVSTSETVQAIATASGYSQSAVGSATYTIGTPAATPTFSPVAGTYSSAQSVTISDSTSGSTIYYTTNGTTPTTSSTVYSGPITISTSETVKAIAAASGYSQSAVGSAAYTIAATAATPTFSPAAGTYTSAQTVTISDSTSGSTIYYTTNGTTPTTSSTVYSGPITVSTSETVEAIATASGYSQSAVGSATYTIGTPAATPTFSPAAGTYTSAQTVTISDSTSGSTIYYTTNGTTPTTSSTVYSGPITVSASETVKAIATASGYSTSAVGSAAYTINLPFSGPVYVQQCNNFTQYGETVACTLSGVGAGHTLVIGVSNLAAGQSGTATSSSGTPTLAVTDSSKVQAWILPNTTSGSITITYTVGSDSRLWLSVAEYSNTATSPLDGTGEAVVTTYGSVIDTPNFTTASSSDVLWSYCSGTGSTPTVGTAPVSWAGITSPTSGTVLVEDGDTASAGTYYGQCTIPEGEIITLALMAPSGLSPAATPSFSPAAGTYTSAQSVTISDSTSGSTIYYTTNGTTPTTSSTVYSSPITVSASETVKAIATASGYSTSAVGSAAYTIDLPAATPTFSPAAGTYTSAQTVTISDSTSGATIYYTTNGTTPTTSSTVYSSPITVSASETVKAIATASGYSTSAVGSAAYTISSGGSAAYVQQCNSYINYTETVSCTLTGVGTGHVLVIGIDSTGTTLTSLTSTVGTPSSVITNGGLYGYILPNTTAGSVTITANFSTEVKVGLSVVEYSNVSSSPLDTSASGTQTSYGTTVSTSNFTTTAGSDMLWSMCEGPNLPTAGTAPITWTALPSPSGSGVQVLVEDGVAGAAGTYYGQCGGINSSVGSIIAIALKGI